MQKLAAQHDYMRRVVIGFLDAMRFGQHFQHNDRIFSLQTITSLFGFNRDSASVR